jgi:biopolymer transport protein ExbD
VPLDLPKASGPSAVLEIVIREDGELGVDGKKLNGTSELLGIARSATAANPDVRAIVRAEKGARHGMVMSVMDVLKQAGVAKIAFGVPNLAPSSSASAP